MKEINCWKKVFESDLPSVSYEIKEFLDLPAVVILSGDMGTGKTTFTKAFTESANEDYKDSPITSPTYSVVNEIGDLVHADFYRLEEEEEVIHLELSLYMEDKKYFLVEWGTKFLPRIQKELGDEFSYYDLKIEMNSENEKSMTYRNYFLSSL